MVSTRRRITSDRSQKYAIGDKVEILRSDGLDVGIILSKAVDSEDEEQEDDSPTTSTTKKWMVSVESGSEEEISEKYLGRILEASDESDETATIDKSDASASKEKKGGKSASALPKKVSFHHAKHEAPSGSSKGSNARRNTRASRNADSIDMEALSDINKKAKRDPAVPRPGKKSKSSAVDGETVVEVKMATGTLYIYKGLKRRVEFIRTV